MLEPIPLKTVRPFVMDDMLLADEAEDAGIALDDKAAVTKLLKNRVRSWRHSCVHLVESSFLSIASSSKSRCSGPRAHTKGRPGVGSQTRGR